MLLRRDHTIKLTLLFILLMISTAALVKYYYKPAIKIGVMHSLTGTMASSEKGLVDAIHLAVNEINQNGGLLGRPIEAIVKDGQSDPKVFAQIAESLISEDKVDVVFGCWTSSCRKAVLPIFEKHNHLLYYPLQYEGLEASKNIIYLGAVPNQQVLPALEWAFSELGKKVFLVGSDYVYPRATNEIIKHQIAKWRGQIVGEHYQSMDSHNFDEIISQIKQTQPDVIFSTINGDSNIGFFSALRANGIQSKDIPTFSFSVSEDEMQHFSSIDMSGDYLVWNYLQSQPNKLNQDFIQRFKSHFGSDRTIGSPMATAYVGVKLWAKSVIKANSSEVTDVINTASDLSINGPAGMIYIDKHSNHAWKPMHIAQINSQKQLQSVWFSKVPIAPIPYPQYKSKAQWKAYIEKLAQ